MRAEAPVDAVTATPGTDAPSLEYKMYLFTPGETTVTSVLGPTLNFVPGRGLRMAVSFDDEVPQTVTVVPATYTAARPNSSSSRFADRTCRTKFVNERSSCNV